MRVGEWSEGRSARGAVRREAGGAHACTQPRRRLAPHSSILMMGLIGAAPLLRARSTERPEYRGAYRPLPRGAHILLLDSFVSFLCGVRFGLVCTNSTYNTQLLLTHRPGTCGCAKTFPRASRTAPPCAARGPARPFRRRSCAVSVSVGVLVRLRITCTVRAQARAQARG